VPSPPARNGSRLGKTTSVAFLLATARPDGRVALIIGIIEQVGEDQRVEGRIVELEGEVVAALLRLLRPGGPDLGATDKDPMAGDIVGGLTGL